MIEPRADAPLPNITKIEALLTRPHTKENDQTLDFTPNTNKPNLYRSQAIELPAHGRWVIQGIIHYQDNQNNPKTGYFRFEFFAEQKS